MSDFDRPARTDAQLLEEFWAAFHHCWGLAVEGRYDKRAWSVAQETATQLFTRVGLERRRIIREPLDLIKDWADAIESGQMVPDDVPRGQSREDVQAELMRRHIARHGTDRRKPKSG